MNSLNASVGFLLGEEAALSWSWNGLSDAVSIPFNASALAALSFSSSKAAVQSW